MNYGRKVEEVKAVALSEAMLLIDNLKKSGQVFRIDFIKKTTNTTRTMVCRFGVRKHVTGGGRKYNPLEKGLLSVYEFGVGYRSIPLDTILYVKSGGVIYDFTGLSIASLNAKTRRHSVPNEVTRGNRTLHAKTSPMYN